MPTKYLHVPFKQTQTGKNWTSLNLFCGHLRLVRLHDEPEAIAGDGPDAEGGHDDGKILTGLHQTAEDFRVGPGIKTTKLFFHNRQLPCRFEL